MSLYTEGLPQPCVCGPSNSSFLDREIKRQTERDRERERERERAREREKERDSD